MKNHPPTTGLHPWLPTWTASRSVWVWYVPVPRTCCRVSGEDILRPEGAQVDKRAGQSTVGISCIGKRGGNHPRPLWGADMGRISDSTGLHPRLPTWTASRSAWVWYVPVHRTCCRVSGEDILRPEGAQVGSPRREPGGCTANHTTYIAPEKGAGGFPVPYVRKTPSGCRGGGVPVLRCVGVSGVRVTQNVML